MARLLIQNVPVEHLALFPSTMTIFFIIVAVAAVSSVVSFLCASHKRVRSQSSDDDCDISQSDNEHKFRLGGISSKALLMAKMISWRKGSDDGDEEALWKKTIMMGERCRPLDFSGRIDYDSQGNQLPQIPRGSPRQMDCRALVNSRETILAS